MVYDGLTADRRAFLKYSGLLAGAAALGLEGCVSAQQRAFNEAAQHYAAGKFDDTIAVLAQYVCQDAAVPSDAYALLGSAHARKGQWAQAETAFNAALRIDDKSAFAYRGRGTVHFRRGEAKQAMQAAFPQKPELGDEALAHFERAVSDLEQAVALDPSKPQAHAFLGFAQYALHDGEKAYVSLNKAVRLLDSGAAKPADNADSDQFWARKARILYEQLLPVYRKDL